MSYRECKSDTFPLTLGDIQQGGFFSGYASIFDVVDNDNDVIEAGAFSGVEARNVKLLWQHRADEPIGLFERIIEDTRGLYVEGRLLLEIEKAREAYALLRSGALKGLSIGYQVREADIDRQTGVRHISALDLLEISLVTFPANEQAGVTKVKSHVPQTVREFEGFLREAGYSRARSKAIAAKGFVPPSVEYKTPCEAEGDYSRCERAIARAKQILINQ